MGIHIIRHFPCLIFSLSMTQCGKPSNDKSHPEINAKRMETAKTHTSNNEWQEEMRKRKLARILAFGTPHMEKRLERDGVDKFLEYMEEEKLRTWERERRIEEAEEKLSPEDRWKYNALGDDEGLVFPHQKEDFLRSKGYL